MYDETIRHLSPRSAGPRRGGLGAILILLLLGALLLTACGKSAPSTTKTDTLRVLPAIPLTVNVDWDEHTTRYWTGWPDDSNPNIVVPTYQVPDAVSVILRLKPAS